MSKSSLKSIAQQLGLSISTVSRALSDHPDVSSETKRNVRLAAEQLKYVPDPIARSLKTQRNNTIGVIVPQIRNFFFSSVISGIESRVYEEGFSLVLCQSNEETEREAGNIRTLVAQRISGVLVSIAQSTSSMAHFSELKARGIPYVFFDRAPDDPSISRVVVDDEESAQAAVLHLLSRGYKRIAHLAGPSHLSIAQSRERGFHKALSSDGRSAGTPTVIRGGMTEEDGCNGMNLLLQMDPRPDAVFCVTDPVAIGAFTVVRDHGLRIPEDVALVGFSNNPITALLDPPMTTVEQPSVEMGRRAASILLEMLDAPEGLPPRCEVLANSLIIRRSS